MRNNVLLVHCALNMVSRDCLPKLILSPGEAALASNMLRQNESKSSLPYKINPFSLHKECKTCARGIQLATDFHISETTENYARKQALCDQFSLLFQKASTPSPSTSRCTLYDPLLFVLLKRMCLFESCLEEDTSFL